MPDALYVYGVIKYRLNSFNSVGVNGERVYILKCGEFGALVHECEEKAYISEDPNKIKEFIIVHNDILNKAMKDFYGVIPLPFNTVIKKGENSAQDNLKKWLDDNKERLEMVWNKIKGKREYGIRIYYEKEKLIEQASNSTEIKNIEESIEGKGEGLNYLLKGKASYKINEIVQNRINQFKQKFFESIKLVVDDIKVNISKISINEKNELLLGLSVLVIDRWQIDKIKRILETNKDFSFQLVGPFAPYSFVEK